MQVTLEKVILLVYDFQHEIFFLPYLQNEEFIVKSSLTSSWISEHLVHMPSHWFSTASLQISAGPQKFLAILKTGVYLDHIAATKPLYQILRIELIEHVIKFHTDYWFLGIFASSTYSQRVVWQKDDQTDHLKMRDQNSLCSLLNQHSWAKYKYFYVSFYLSSSIREGERRNFQSLYKPQDSTQLLVRYR